MTRLIDLAGQRFGRLVVVVRAASVSSGAAWGCVCDCGSAKVIPANNLRTGHTTSCGCHKHERLRSGLRLTHGKHGSAEYGVWASMRGRCADKSDKDYGGRGIAVCARWDDFESFLTDMGPRPLGMTIERDDVNGDYEPGNCRWATQQEQANNTRRNRLLTVAGRTQTLQQWAREVGIPRERIKHRLRLGWPAEHAIKAGAYVRYHR